MQTRKLQNTSNCSYSLGGRIELRALATTPPTNARALGNRLLMARLDFQEALARAFKVSSRPDLEKEGSGRRLERLRSGEMRERAPTERAEGLARTPENYSDGRGGVRATVLPGPMGRRGRATSVWPPNKGWLTFRRKKKNFSTAFVFARASPKL